MLSYMSYNLGTEIGGGKEGCAVGSFAKSKMVNSRVPGDAAERAASVLSRSGLTMSEFLRNCVVYVAREREVPEMGLGHQAPPAPEGKVSSFLAEVGKLPMPGKDEHPGLGGDALVERLKMERYGY